MIIQGHIHAGFRLICFYSMHDIHQTLNHLFCSVQNALDDKIWEDQVKMSVKNFSLKPAEFYLRGINKLPNKWQGLIQNNDEYNIDWNSLLYYSWIYILWKKQSIYDLTIYTLHINSTFKKQKKLQ